MEPCRRIVLVFALLSLGLPAPTEAMPLCWAVGQLRRIVSAGKLKKVIVSTSNPEIEKLRLFTQHNARPALAFIDHDMKPGEGETDQSSVPKERITELHEALDEVIDRESGELKKWWGRNRDYFFTYENLNEMVQKRRTINDVVNQIKVGYEHYLKLRSLRARVRDFFMNPRSYLWLAAGVGATATGTLYLQLQLTGNQIFSAYWSPLTTTWIEAGKALGYEHWVWLQLTQEEWMAKRDLAKKRLHELERLNDEELDPKHFQGIPREEAIKKFASAQNAMMQLVAEMYNMLPRHRQEARQAFRELYVTWPTDYGHKLTSMENNLILHSNAVETLKDRATLRPLTKTEEAKLARHEIGKVTAEKRIVGTLAAWKFQQFMYPETLRPEFWKAIEERDPVAAQMLRAFEELTDSMSFDVYVEGYAEAMKGKLEKMGLAFNALDKKHSIDDKTMIGKHPTAQPVSPK